MRVQVELVDIQHSRWGRFRQPSIKLAGRLSRFASVQPIGNQVEKLAALFK
jgi:hypothetical protein